MTESTPFNPNSEKGKVRAELDEILLGNEYGSLQAIIANQRIFIPALRQPAPPVSWYLTKRSRQTAQWL
jgi:hypothetical protein